MTSLLLAAAAICFTISASRRFGSVPWIDIGLVLLTVALIFALPGGVRVDVD